MHVAVPNRLHYKLLGGKPVETCCTNTIISSLNITLSPRKICLSKPRIFYRNVSLSETELRKSKSCHWEHQPDGPVIEQKKKPVVKTATWCACHWNTLRCCVRQWAQQPVVSVVKNANLLCLILKHTNLLCLSLSIPTCCVCHWAHQPVMSVIGARQPVVPAIETHQPFVPVREHTNLLCLSFKRTILLCLS